MYICRVEDRIGNGYTGRAAGGSDGRVDRVRAELNGNPVQSGGLNRERLYRAGFGPPRRIGLDGRADRTRVELNGRERDRIGNGIYRAAAVILHHTFFPKTGFTSISPLSA